MTSSKNPKPQNRPKKSPCLKKKSLCREKICFLKNKKKFFIKSASVKLKSRKSFLKKANLGSANHSSSSNSVFDNNASPTIESSKLGSLVNVRSFTEKNLADKVKKLEEENADLKYKALEEKRISEKFTRSASSLQKEVNTLTLELNFKKEEYISLTELVNQVKSNNSSLKKQISDKAHEYDELSDRLKVIEQNYFEQTAKLNSAKDQAVNLSAEISALQKEKSEIINSLKEIEKSKENVINSLTDTIKDLTDSNETLRKKFDLEHKENQQLKEQLKIKDEDNQSLSSAVAKLSRGIKTAVPYCSPDYKPVQTKETYPSPEAFLSVVPFCFPNNLPPILHTDQELQRCTRSELARAEKKQPPVIFPSRAFQDRVSAHSPAPMFVPLEASISDYIERVQGFKKDIIYVEVSSVKGLHGIFSEEMEECKTRNRIFFSAVVHPELLKNELGIFRQKKETGIKRLNMPPVSIKKCFNFSFAGYTEYLSKTIISDCGWHLQKEREKLIMQVASVKRAEFAESDIKANINEILAFRQRITLEFCKRIPLKSEVKFEFGRENKLRNVLATFSKTIDSMVKQFEQKKKPERG